MDRVPPNPAKLLQAWMEWERGDSLPGRTMSSLKTGGLRELLEGLVAQVPAEEAATKEEAPTKEEARPSDKPAEENWTPVV